MKLFLHGYSTELLREFSQTEMRVFSRSFGGLKPWQERSCAQNPGSTLGLAFFALPRREPVLVQRPDHDTRELALERRQGAHHADDLRARLQFLGEQLARREPERRGQLAERLEAWRDSAPFEALDGFRGDLGGLGEGFLGEPVTVAEGQEALAELLGGHHEHLAG